MTSIGRSSTVRWVLLAIAGLAVAAAVGVAASKLTSQRIGLASEPLKAGEALAPRSADHSGRGRSGPDSGGDRGATTATTSTSSTTTTTTPATTTPTDDDGSGSGESAGGGDSDD